MSHEGLSLHLFLALFLLSDSVNCTGNINIGGANNQLFWNLTKREDSHIVVSRPSSKRGSVMLIIKKIIICP